jgi:hypothetical protein
MEVNNNQVDNVNNNNIMRELSIIKASLAVGTSETVNIKESIAEIKVDIKEIKTGYINQEQHKALVDTIAKCIVDATSLEKRVTEIEMAKTRQNVMMTIGIGILTTLVGLLIYHIVGK